MGLTYIGTIGLGLVWGWLIGSLRGRISNPLRTWSSVAVTTLFLSILVFVFVGWYETILLTGAATLAGWLHAAWREHLSINRKTIQF